jgi:TrmH family RNA methyltransferase
MLYSRMQMQQTSPHKPITSKENSVIKHLRSLSDPKHRRNEQAFLIEGVKMVEEALRDNLGVKTVIASPSLVQHHGKGVLKLAESRSVDVIWISEKLMDTVSENKTPQPVMAVVRMREYSESALLANEAGLIIIAHQLQDPGNLGTIIRTAEAAGASGIAVTPHTVDPYGAKAIRASMGSILRLPLVRIGDAATFIRTCKQTGFQIAATVLTGEMTPFDIDLRKPTVVILGQEGAGLPLDIMTDIDLHVRIPMAKTIDSLNVATSAAVILYEAMRQRLKG